jgi:hypothetical protein
VSVRTILIALLALTGIGIVLRNTFVDAYAESDPARAAQVWAGHPRVLVSEGLTEIGEAAARRRPPPAGALAKIARAATLAPLSHDAFLVRGISAQQAGDLGLAERAFVAARQRAPREAAPHYFLSQLYITSGRGTRGLGELATLARLLPNGAASVAPSLAAYAEASGDLTNLKSTFRSHPELEDAVLTELSRDPANAGLAMRLASRWRAADGGAPAWAVAMLPRLADAGQFETAYRLWEAASGARARATLFNPKFDASKAPPPFNWTLRSDSAGAAEPDGKGGLHIVFYGREDAVLAAQTVMLAPGQHRLAMTVAGNPAATLRWSVSCLPSKTEILSLPLGATAGGSPAGTFVVGGACIAQRLELKGVSEDIPKQADVTISRLSLTGGADGR